MTTVVLPPREFTPDQQREFALGYSSRPHGTKAAYLAEHGLSYSQVRRWMAAMMDGDLEHGQVPRHTVCMTRKDAAEIRRLNARIADLEKRLAASEQDKNRYAEAVGALGKAIGAMQSRGANSEKDE